MADFSAGNRVMRDQVLALLLSGQKSSRSARASLTPAAAPAPAPVPAPTGSPAPSRRPFDSWTPGSHLGAATPGAQLSPVTPDAGAVGRLPTDADVRLAEITAGLVAASDKERRQTDTIRKLALQLERSELQMRAMGPPPPVVASEHTTSTATVRSEKSGRRRDENARRDSARRSRGRNRETRRSEELAVELDALRQEKRDWLRREKAARKEARDMIGLLADIRKNAQRVLAERDGHLRVIARLHQQLHDAAPRTPPRPPTGTPPRGDDSANVADAVSVADAGSVADAVDAAGESALRTPPPVELATPASPGPVALPRSSTVRAQPPSPMSAHGRAYGRAGERDWFTRTESLPDFAQRPVPEQRPRSVSGEVTLPFQQFEEQQVEDSYTRGDRTETGPDGRGAAGDDSGDGPVAGYLRKELCNVLMENRNLSNKVAALQDALAQYEREASHVEVSGEVTQSATDAQDTRPNSTSGNVVEESVGTAEGAAAERPPAEALCKLFELDDELRVLEGVVECMEFSIDTEEAERLQHTLSTIGYDGSNTPSFGQNREGDEEEAVRDFAGKLQTLAKRVAEIRSTIALKYGKWLSDFGHQSDDGDDTVTLPLGATLGALPALDDITITQQ